MSTVSVSSAHEGIEMSSTVVGAVDRRYKAFAELKAQLDDKRRGFIEAKGLPPLPSKCVGT